MKTLSTFLVLATFTMSLQSFAATGCQPNCSGGQNEPHLPGSGPHTPSTQVSLAVIGYAEIPSPTCDEEDLAKAIKVAHTKAVDDAQFYLGKDAVITKAFRFVKRCEQGMYANSAPGNSWLVQAFATYERKRLF